MKAPRLLPAVLVVLLLFASAAAQDSGETGAPPSPETLRSAPAATRPAPNLSSDARELRDQLRRCLAYYLFRPESPARRSPWEIMHAIVGFGVDTRLDAHGEDVSAIGWLCWNQLCKGQRLFELDGERIVTPIAAGQQGHEGQFLHILALARVPADYPMKIGGHKFTVADLVQHEQVTCEPATELSFKLAALTYYLESGATWKDARGETWTVERLLQEEVAQPIHNGVACGGTHRLLGLGFAVRERQLRGEPLTGQWLAAKQRVEEYAARAFASQNADGSFSTIGFEGPSNYGDADDKLETTGHTLEWLLASLPDERLQDPRLTRALKCLTTLMWNHRGRAWEMGPLGHALHALALYDERVFGGRPGQRRAELAAVRDDDAAAITGDPQPDLSASRPAVESRQPPRRVGLFGRGRR